MSASVLLAVVTTTLVTKLLPAVESAVNTILLRVPQPPSSVNVLLSTRPDPGIAGLPT